MSKLFEFNEAQFNNFFPYFILLDKELCIVSLGISLQKICEAKPGDAFEAHFYFKRPYENIEVFEDLHNLTKHLVIIASLKKQDIILRGQLDFLEDKKSFLFVGTPWFDSMDQVRNFGLGIKDFALHDPMIDLLHVLKNQEITTKEIQQLLTTVNIQKNKLEESEFKYRSIVEKASDIIYKYSLDGHYTYINEKAVLLTGYSEEEILKMDYLFLVRDDYKSKVEELYINQIKNRIPTTYFEFPIITKSGKEIWIGQSVQYHRSEISESELTALAIDITEKKQAEFNLRLQEEKYRNIITNMNLGLLEVDLHDVIQFANHSFCEISGYSLEELTGKKAAELLMDESDKTVVLEKSKIRKKGISDMYSVPVKNKKGELRWWVISGAPRYNDSGELVGSVGIHLDVTEQKALEEELKLAKHKAEESSKAKESFLATMSHEIRTPLNATVGITNMMQMNPTSVNKENIDILSFSSKNLHSLITDILDFSKIEAGKIDLSKNFIEVRKVLDGIYQTFRPAVEEKGVELNLVISENVPKVVIGDELRLSQILINLISNAVKFTMQGIITISVSAISIALHKVQLKFEVVDTGIGIKKNKLNRIFLKYEQANRSIAKTFGGTGLGLNITQKLVEIQGGILTVKSKVNKGSSFSFSINYKIPYLQQSSSKIAKKTSELNSIETQHRKVLLVEDNLINQKVAMSYLNFWHLQADIANHGKEALELLKTTKYDLILMDLFMPVMDGFETIHLIKNDVELSKIPIIALTASAETSIMRKALHTGADKCLTKPFNARQLHDTILEFLIIQDNGIEKEASNSIVTEFEKINLNILEEASLNSREFIAEMLQLILNDSSFIIEKCEQHLERNEYQQFSSEIHKLKNGLLTIGMSYLKEGLNFMEEKAKKGESIAEIHSHFENLKFSWKNAIPDIKSAILKYTA